MPDQKEKKRRILSRFIIPKQTLGWAVFAFVLCIFIYIGLEAYMGNGSWDWQGAAKSVVIVLTSIIGTTLITGFLIEKKSRNEIFTETFLDELAFSGQEHEKNRKKLLALLERDFYFGGSRKKQEIYESIIQRRDKALQNYYLTKSEHQITCTIHPDRIEKEIVRVIWLRSYEETYVEKNFVLAGQVVSPYSTLTIQEVIINGEARSPSDYECMEDSKSVGSLDQKNAYLKRRSYYCKQPLHLSNRRDTKIIVKYKTTVPPDDFTYSLRVRQPCKEYRLDFHIVDSQGRDCCLSAHAFGFCEDAINTPNDSDPNRVIIQFEDWIFFNDGICVSFYPKPKAVEEKDTGAEEH